jgi:hypothetical protein
MQSVVDHSDLMKIVTRARSAIMICSLVAGATIFLAPLPETRQTVIKCHYFGLALLFVFLSMGEVCHLRIFVQYCKRVTDWSVIVRIARFWWALTELAPGAAAIVILSSGLRLVYEGGYSLGMTWLLILVVGFGFFFADGILGYTKEVRNLEHLTRAVSEGGSEAEARELIRGCGFNATFLIHSFSLPLLYLVGSHKPVRPQFMREPISALARALFPVAGRMTGVITAVIVILIVALIVIVSRWRK